MLRVGIVGLGFGATVVCPAFRSDSRCQVIGLASRHPEKTREAAGRLSVPRAFESWTALVNDPEVDAIAIAVPPRGATRDRPGGASGGKAGVL